MSLFKQLCIYACVHLAVLLLGDSVWSVMYNPGACFCCSVGGYYQSSFYEYFRVVVKHTGSVTWQFGGPLKVSCPIDTTMYPFDRQRCRLLLGNWAYSVEYVDLQNASSEIHTQGDPDSGIVRYSKILFICYRFHVRSETGQM